MIWLIQVKYTRPVPEAAPDGWTTVAAAHEMREAGRAAAFVYRDREHPAGGRATQLRIRCDDEVVARQGLAALEAAMDSLRAATAASERSL